MRTWNTASRPAATDYFVKFTFSIIKKFDTLLKLKLHDEAQLGLLYWDLCSVVVKFFDKVGGCFKRRNSSFLNLYESNFGVEVFSSVFLNQQRQQILIFRRPVST